MVDIIMARKRSLILRRWRHMSRFCAWAKTPAC